MVRQPLALEEAKVPRLIEADLARGAEEEAAAVADVRDDPLSLVRIDLVRALSRKAEQDGAIGRVAFAGQRERAVEVDLDPLRLLEQGFFPQRLDKAARGRHRPHGVGARRADPDLEEVEDAGNHRKIS
jgi:hypothetical protein